jgi:hypothetical protein
MEFLEKYVPYRWQRLRRRLGLVHTQSFYAFVDGGIMMVSTDSVPIASLTDAAGNVYHKGAAQFL